MLDSRALSRALREGLLAGAVCDVFPEEPLAPDSDLWETPNLILTPHISGERHDDVERVSAIVADNLTRFLDGRPLLNVVDREKGY